MIYHSQEWFKTLMRAFKIICCYERLDFFGFPLEK